jgi:hypothetical protein
MATSEETSGRRVALPAVIAGLLGTLAGTVVGGLISLAAVEQNIRAAEASNLRASRQSAYSVFLADANQHTQLIKVSFEDDNEIDSVEEADLAESTRGLQRSYAVALLVASDAVYGALLDLEKAASNYEQVALEEEEGDVVDLSIQVDQALLVFMDSAGDDLGAAKTE